MSAVVPEVPSGFPGHEPTQYPRTGGLDSCNVVKRPVAPVQHTVDRLTEQVKHAITLADTLADVADRLNGSHPAGPEQRSGGGPSGNGLLSQLDSVIDELTRQHLRIGTVVEELRRVFG